MTHSTHKVILTPEYAQKLYKFLNEVNVTFEEKEELILELRKAYQEAFNNNENKE